MNWYKLLFLGLFAAAFAFLLAGCIAQSGEGKIAPQGDELGAGEIVCNKPYLRVGKDCCLDQDNDAICDRDEAGGISTPASALAAFSMGAAYILTGSINQCSVEAGTSDVVREMLTRAGQADVIMAPAADMFEMGVKVQVLKWGTMFAMRAARLNPVDALRDASVEQLQDTQEVGPVLAASVRSWFDEPRNLTLVERLRRAACALRLPSETRASRARSSACTPRWMAARGGTR